MHPCHRTLIDVLTTAQTRDQTVGTLLSRAYASGGCTLGGIFGTGTNGAYVEDIANITKLGNSVTGAGGSMVVNTEWGAFNNSVRIRFTHALVHRVTSIRPFVRCSERHCRGHRSTTSSTANPSTPRSRPSRSSSRGCTSARSRGTLS